MFNADVGHGLSSNLQGLLDGGGVLRRRVVLRRAVVADVESRLSVWHGPVRVWRLFRDGYEEGAGRHLGWHRDGFVRPVGIGDPAFGHRARTDA